MTLLQQMTFENIVIKVEIAHYILFTEIYMIVFKIVLISRLLPICCMWERDKLYPYTKNLQQTLLKTTRLSMDKFL